MEEEWVGFQRGMTEYFPGRGEAARLHLDGRRSVRHSNTLCYPCTPGPEAIQLQPHSAEGGLISNCLWLLVWTVAHAELLCISEGCTAWHSNFPIYA